MTSIKRIERIVVVSFLVGLPPLLGACDDDDGEPAPLYMTVVETKKLIVGGGLATDPPAVVTFGSGKNVVELEAPGNVVAARAEVTVSLVTGVVQKGQVPVNNAGLFVQPAGVVFAAPVKVRQSVPPPPIGRSYSSVVVPDGKDTFVATTPARRVGPPTTDPTTGEVLERWEGEGTGSGLWGLAVGDLGAGADAGAGDAGRAVAEMGGSDSPTPTQMTDDPQY